jgi:hypothetical protein
MVIEIGAHFGKVSCRVASSKLLKDLAPNAGLVQLKLFQSELPPTTLIRESTMSFFYINTHQKLWKSLQ